MCRFAVENFVIEKHVRYILTVYPVVIFALSGSLSKHYDAAAPGRNAVFSGESVTVCVPAIRSVSTQSFLTHKPRLLH